MTSAQCMCLASVLHSVQKVNCIRTRRFCVSRNSEMGRVGHLQCDKLMAAVLLEMLVGNGYLDHFS